MASTLTRVLVHITFSTKHRAPVIHEDVEPHLYAYIGGICRGLSSPLLTIGGTPDHLHLLVSLAKTLALSELLLAIKRDTSRWVNARPGYRGFAWQEGYFAFSIGESNIDSLRAYIQGQKEHHKKVDFKDEIRAFLRKYGIEWDEQHVWS